MTILNAIYYILKPNKNTLKLIYLEKTLKPIIKQWKPSVNNPAYDPFTVI